MLGFQVKQIAEVTATGDEERGTIAADLALVEAYVRLGQTELINFDLTGEGRKSAVKEKKEQKVKDKHDDAADTDMFAKKL